MKRILQLLLEGEKEGAGLLSPTRKGRGAHLANELTPKRDLEMMFHMAPATIAIGDGQWQIKRVQDVASIIESV